MTTKTLERFCIEEKKFAPYSPMSFRYAKNMKIKIGDKFLDVRQVGLRRFKILTDESSHDYLKNWIKENFNSGKTTYGCDLIVMVELFGQFVTDSDYSVLLLNCYPDGISNIVQNTYIIIRFDSHRRITKAEKRDRRLEEVLTEIFK